MGMPRSLRIPLSLSIDEAVGTQRVVLVSYGPQVLEETCFESLALIVLDPDVKREMSEGVQIKPLIVLSDVSAVALDTEVLVPDTETDRA